jgi:hypothetical protein
VTERGEDGVARILDLHDGVGADSVLECVGTAESFQQAIRVTRPGGSIGYVGVPHGVVLDGTDLFHTHVRLHGGPAPVRRYLPELIDLVLRGEIDPGRCSTSRCRSLQVARATARWTSVAPSRRSCDPEETLMRMRRLGTSNLEVSALGFGCMGISFGYGPGVSRQEGISILRAAVDGGVTSSTPPKPTVPTATRSWWGRHWRPVRDRVVIATKFGFKFDGSRR